MKSKLNFFIYYTILATIGAFTLASCCDDDGDLCLYDCRENTICDGGACRCIDPEMFMFGGESSGEEYRSCMYFGSTETVRRFRPIEDGHNCRCVPDFLVIFGQCSSGSSSPILVGTCNVRTIYKDKETEDVYRGGTGPGSGSLPVGEGGQDEFEVFFDLVTDTHQVCPELDYPIDYIRCSGMANHTIDTLFLTMSVVPADDRDIEDICNFKMVLIPERD